MLVPWFNYNACSITRDSQEKRVQFARQHAKVRDFTSRHACLEVKFGFRQVQVCFIGGSLPVILSSMGRTVYMNKLRTKFNNENIGLYRDDGLAAFRNMGPRTADKIKKQFIDTFKEYGLKITIESNLKIVNYLDITLDLSNGKYYPYRKHGNPPQYVNAKSNHPPQIIKQLPASISKRIARLSCDEAEFNKAATQYNEALKSSGFKTSLKYKSKSENTTPNKARRRRNIICTAKLKFLNKNKILAKLLFQANFCLK